MKDLTPAMLSEIKNKRRFSRLREIVAKSLRASESDHLQDDVEDLIAELLYRGLFRESAEQRDTLVMVVAVAALTAFLAEVNAVLPEASGAETKGDSNGWN